MTSQRFFGNPDFLAYARMLRELHQLIRAHADDTQQGEALREQMDGPTECLTADEVECLNAISADFYTLAGSPHAGPANPPLSCQNELRVALDARDFVKALALVRMNETILGPLTVAQFRAKVWLQAGEPDIAADFFRRAQELAGNNGTFAKVLGDDAERGDGN